MSAVTESQPAKKWAMPDTLVIIFFVAILTSLATWVVPVGMFDSQEVQYQVDGQTKTRKVVDPHSFRILTNDAGEEQYHRVQLFTTGDERPGLRNFPFEGVTSGSKFGTAVGIIMFMLVIGGAFGIVMRTGTIDNGILALIRHTRGNEVLFIPVQYHHRSGYLYRDSDWFRQLMDEPILRGGRARYCGSTGALWFRATHRGLGDRYTNRADLHAGLCGAYQKESAFVPGT